MNIIFWLIVAILVVGLLPEAIIYISGIFCAIYDKLFNKEQKHREKIYKEFDKLFGGRPYKRISTSTVTSAVEIGCYRRISDLQDEHYEKHHTDPKYVRYCMTEFAVRYIDPKTMNYNDQYRLEWNK